MGTWGARNFENDSAADWIETLSDPITSTIEEGLEDHDEGNGEEIMAAVETLAVLCENFPLTPPEADAVARWRKAYLAGWNEYIDEIGPEPDYKAARQKVIESTFNRLAAAAENRSR